MADSADGLLGAVARIHRRWLAGELSEEDALFEIGDLLGEPSGTGEKAPSADGEDDPSVSS